MVFQVGTALGLIGSIGMGGTSKVGLGRRILGGIGKFFKPGGTATGLFGKGWFGKG